MDVENLTFAVLDRDQTTVSRDHVLNLSGSQYFTEKAPITDYGELDRRMRSGELSLAIEIPPGFGRDFHSLLFVPIGGRSHLGRRSKIYCAASLSFELICLKRCSKHR